ncbi:MAG: DUF6876 family protein [Kordia sp.]|uniref:DUF6876 family protein n=1 Tax=Kordia sp. TaxID=1965332 RepID=UPI00385DED9C
MIDTQKLQHELKQFTGTEQYYKNPLFSSFVFTDGVKYLAEQAEAYWLIDYVMSNQYDLYLAIEPFQIWTIKVTNNQANIVVEDGNGKELKKYNIAFTDFPLDEITLWFTDRTLLLPSEY